VLEFAAAGASVGIETRALEILRATT